MNPARIKNLIAEYRKRKFEIKARLKDFASFYKGEEKAVFSELCFCILTANANALLCDEAIRDIVASGMLLAGTAGGLKPKLKGRVRFHNKKARFIVEARSLFMDGGRIAVKKRISPKDISATRDWLVENVKGLGYKEASHFLRNIGLGRDIAILDRHILKNLRRYGVISGIPSSPGSRKIYLAIEDKMRAFSRKVGIPLPELDLLFWSLQTGFIFK